MEKTIDILVKMNDRQSEMIKDLLNQVNQLRKEKSLLEYKLSAIQSTLIVNRGTLNYNK